MKETILVTDDDLTFLSLIREILEDWGYRVLQAENGSKTINILQKNQVDLLLLDLKMPPKGIQTGFDLLEKIFYSFPFLPVVIISSYGDIKNVMRATRLGIHDFLEKPINPDRLSLVIKSALEKGKFKKITAILLEQMKEKYKMVGVSQSMREIFHIVEKIAPTDCRVLITGETGVGKELVARAIHLRSKRAGGPFVNESCASIPEELAESLLFGHKKGAFTGAIEDRKGWFQLADGGTLFLDEIGDLSKKIQAKILKVLDEGKFKEVGGEKTLKTDVRIIAATNKNLEKAVEKGDFRKDLFFRINEVSIFIPPLRERKEDIPLLVDFFMERKCEEYGVPIKRVLPSAMNLFLQYEWPGNVRELEWTISRLVLFVDEEIITPIEVAKVLRLKKPLIKKKKKLKELREEWEREYIKQVLIANNWNIKRTAEELGIERTNLYRKMRSLGIRKE
jgi:two-component system nitrogen regulation response regulator NtrX